MGIMAPLVASGGVDFYVKSRVPGSHLLQIDGYSIAKQATNGTSFKSCPFTVGGYRWAIYLFPNGDWLDSADFISVLLALDEHVKGPIRVHLEFSFMDEVEKQDPRHVCTRQVVDLHGGYAVGYRRFIAREAMENSKHLKGDRFTIRCDLFVLKHVIVQENLHASGHRKCEACNIRVATMGGRVLVHACFCDVCNHASRNDAAAKQCAGCHGPYEGFFLPLLSTTSIS
ncbi:hypothetical protein CFC21_068670 [Triticum aestivum]|uniref:MATH domain-containing protein n=2 Tax=Triticum aestivum TaxID=4565 RepID=A0A3B6KQV8_WHEAT|nr:hypothetical protein CFC21_068670 [Triticum aestivum]